MKVLILGIGNVMFSDEGVGVHLCRLVEQKYQFSSPEHTITFVDGGTLAERLIPVIAEYEYLVVLDCVDAHDGKIGDVYFFDFDNVPNTITWQGSVHEVEMLQTLTMMDLVGDRPTTKIVGIIPEVVDDTTLELTPAVLKGSVVMESVLLKHLVELGFTYEQMSDIDIQSVANLSCLEDR
ncbi:HyaD/HybD family hydrogenase maturation endopeptidase [Sulfurospirillum multivorans]|uniref:NiFe hydrogenase maturation protease HydD n=2 Tax=Sulfurospirillum multivorans TaxID=66821 RepID=A0AA86E2E9_SULMK|nr:HyaD/HybD family hydrogenase maturation endopeptidase [Sulfurospirillum multivorans]AHJ12687.1 NiFe hydrogenase maturation protease HydD [Sulfurospirillum multivorans DSM 12446]QEH06182.1 NiFe hydrogenase maturation protease HydD [Sulfurospirillum multivorans]